MKTGSGDDQPDGDGSVSQGQPATSGAASGSGSQSDTAEGVHKVLKSMLDGMCPVPQKIQGGDEDEDDDDDGKPKKKPRKAQAKTTKDETPKDPEVPCPRSCANASYQFP